MGPLHGLPVKAVSYVVLELVEIVIIGGGEFLDVLGDFLHLVVELGLHQHYIIL